MTEAHRAWQYLVRRHGAPAPGLGAELGLVVPPSAREWALVPSWSWHRAGVDAKGTETILRALRLAPRLEEASAMPGTEAAARLMRVPGLGPWTAAETLQRCNGDPDAVSVGDLHLPNTVAWALAGKAHGTHEENARPPRSLRRPPPLRLPPDSYPRRARAPIRPPPRTQ
ncbi:hypothetical protein [Kitasatospora sp. NPDC085879]|uniref:DNA-3-methyladenine glycosylase family protein n=1 Tax=Kitasatospora sp. NPDC085879 TaxID=3154769 RepID=UPI0034315F3A